MQVHGKREYMIPEYPKFKPLTIDGLPQFAGFLKTHPASICELSPANLIIWKDFDRPEATLINGNLCIRINPLSEPPFFLEPLGGNKLPETIGICLENAKKLSRVSDPFIKSVDHAKYHIACLRGHFDYIYATHELAELKGKKFDGKRNHIKRFMRTFPQYQFVKLTKEHKHPALGLFEKWFTTKQGERYYSRMAYDAQKNALISAFHHFETLNLSGGALITDDRLMGFILGSALNKETVSVHFQYCDPEVKGAAQTILQEACSKTFAHYKFIDLEQDLGIPGLRKAKLSYHPLRLEKKFEISARI